MSDLEQLATKLQQLGYTDNFFALDIPVNEALSMDNPTLMRRINEANGSAEAFRQQVEMLNRENNDKILKLLKSDDFTRIVT